MTALLPLASAIEAVSVPGVTIAFRTIADGDEQALLPDELPAFGNSVVKVRRASGAARIVARSLFERFGETPRAIPKSLAGMPVWPDGIVGSIAHDNQCAVVAMARRSDFAGLGVDVEPAQAIDP